MINGYDTRYARLGELIQSTNTTRNKLIRANPLTCTNLLPGRLSCSSACAACGGTGYTGGSASDDFNTAGSPYNTIYFIDGEFQSGHGLRGAGGESNFVDSNIGSVLMGDAIFYYAANQREPQTGIVIEPLPNNSPRPDRLIRTVDHQVFTVLHRLDENVGVMPVYRAVSLGIGIQGVGIPGVQN